MAPASATFSGEQIVVAVAFVKVRRFGQADSHAGKNVFPLADQLACGMRIFLQHDAREAVLSRPMIPELIDQIFTAVILMEQRWIEAAAVEIHRVRPITIDGGAGDQIVVEVTKRGARRTAYSG